MLFFGLALQQYLCEQMFSSHFEDTTDKPQILRIFSKLIWLYVILDHKYLKIIVLEIIGNKHCNIENLWANHSIKSTLFWAT